MILSSLAGKLRSAFIQWTMKRNGRVVKQDYALYHCFFTTLPNPESFWEKLAASPVATTYGPHYRFMAGVKLLLLDGVEHPIRNLYPDLVTELDESKIPAGDLFQDFCESNWTQIISTALRRDVQINKVGRCALFLPLFAEAFDRAGRKPLGLIEVGASAGLGMLWPHIAYRYGLRHQAGPKDAPLVLRCRVRGGKGGQVQSAFPTVARQIGLELNPFNLREQQDAHWLLALTAPNNLLNLEQVRIAIAMAQSASLEVRRGCVLDTLEAAFCDLPSDSTSVIFHSLTIHHLDEQKKLASFVKLLGELSRRRDFFQATVEWGSFRQDYGKPLSLRLHHWTDGRCDSTELFGFTDPAADGRWIILA